MDQSSMPAPIGPRVGFVGTGYIAEAMVEAFLGEGAPASIVLSPRGADTAARLAGRHPHAVKIASDNQKVLDVSEFVILAVRPADVDGVLRTLRFRSDHKVVNVVASLTLAEARRRTAPAGVVTMALPLPAMRHGGGATVLMPPDPQVAALFERGGIVIGTEDEDAYAALGTSTSVMASQITLADGVAAWLADHGVPDEAARRYVCGMLEGVCGTMERSLNRPFADLAVEHATPGSLNEDMRRRLTENGTFRTLRDGLDVLLPRMRGV